MSKLLGEISKNSIEKIRVTETTYKGYDFIDVRTFIINDRYALPIQTGTAHSR